MPLIHSLNIVVIVWGNQVVKLEIGVYIFIFSTENTVLLTLECINCGLMGIVKIGKFCIG